MNLNKSDGTLQVVPTSITEELEEWTRKLDSALKILQLPPENRTTQPQWDEWKQAASSSVRDISFLLKDRKAFVDNWLEQSESSVSLLSTADENNKKQGVECSVKDMENELINAKLQLAQVEEENARLELAYHRLSREGNSSLESSASELSTERFELAKQRVEEAELERGKLLEEIERVQSQLFLCRRKNQLLLEEYRALEGEWN